MKKTKKTKRTIRVQFDRSIVNTRYNIHMYRY